MAIRAILFDKDGTLIDVNGTWIPFYKEILQIEHGVSEAEASVMMEWAGYDPSLNRFRPNSVLAGGTTQQLVRLWWKDAADKDIPQIARRIDADYAPRAVSHLKALMPLEPILDNLREAGFLLGVGTNDSKISADGHMRALGIEDRFSAILGADSVARPKPSGEMLKAFAAKAGVKPSEVAMVGDSTHDLEEARHGGGGLAVGVLTGSAAHEDLQHFADHVLPSIADLPELLRRA